MAEGWQIARLWGIPLRIHPTWLAILLLCTVAFERSYRPAGSGGEPMVWGLAFLTALLLFVSVLLHELGHSLVALSQGVKVRSITLFFLGGVASVDRECATPTGAALVAAAGPAVSLALGFLFLALRAPAGQLAPGLGQMVLQLGWLNLTLALFNLLPGLPLDGGLLLKALVWQISGSQRRGIQVANGCGRFLSLMALGLGTWMLLKGNGGSGLWLLVLGWFGLGAARRQAQLLRLQTVLKEGRVAEASRRRFRVVEASGSLRQLSQQRLQAADPAVPGPAAVPGAAVPGAAEIPGLPPWILVCDRGRWQGVIDDGPLQTLPVQRWDGERIGDHAQPLDTLPSIPEQAPLWQAVLRLDDPEVSRLLVLNPAGLPTGTLERPDLGEVVFSRLGVRVPPPLLALARRHNAYPMGLGLAQVARSMLSSGEVQGAEASTT
ncbi:MAG: M50 family metallopeptidase [Cyanobacteria bacterium]|nr:M50 family metallopeptidase [Cyanobacteriota bacterium]